MTKDPTCDILKLEGSEGMVLNKKWFFFIALFLALIVLGALVLGRDATLAIAIISVGAVLTVGYVFLFPSSFMLNEEGITVFYIFMIRTTLKWDEISHIKSCLSRATVFFWKKAYRVGFFKTKFTFWQEATLPKNKTTVQLLGKYYKGEILGFIDQ